MRLDHLLSKEHLKVSVSFHSGGRAGFAGDAHIEDASSSVGAQGWNINRQVPGVEPGSTVRPSVILWMIVCGLERLPVTSSTGFYRLAHCWVLKQQGRMN